MADYTITATNVDPGSEANPALFTAGEVIDAGEFVYQSTADNKVYLARANDSSTATVLGYAVSSAVAADQIIGIARTDADADFGFASGDSGDALWLSAATAGKAAPYADLVSTNIPRYLGTVKADGKVGFNPHNAGGALP